MKNRGRCTDRGMIPSRRAKRCHDRYLNVMAVMGNSQGIGDFPDHATLCEICALLCKWNDPVFRLIFVAGLTNTRLLLKSYQSLW